MAITISDVANEAGVSKSTVSKVLNHWTTISPETVARVQAAIDKLHYVPNARARMPDMRVFHYILFTSFLSQFTPRGKLFQFLV